VTQYVVDASVAIKWLVPEIHSAAACRLIDPTLQLWAPDLVYAELGNVLWKKVRRGDLTADEGRRVAARLSTLVVRIVSAETLVGQAYEMAIALNRTVYDALYAALARDRGIQMVTADLRLYNTLKSSLYASHALWIEDLP
jgi:predicted nucleic acid-binding protein